MARSSSSSYSNVESGPIDHDVLWMQKNHVSQHIWNGQPDRKLKIRRAVPTHIGQEQIPEQIIPLLEVSGFYWVMKLGYLKVNGGLINAFIERWRPETHTFHLKCGECTITLEDVSVLLGLCVDGKPLIGSTNFDWANLCEELLGVRPAPEDIDGSTLRLTWLASHFDNVNDYTSNEKHLQMFARSWILRYLGGALFVDKSSSRVSLRYLQFLRDFKECGTYAWGAATLSFLYREMCNATNYSVKSIGGFTPLIQLWAWERCPKLTPIIIPHQQINEPLGNRWNGLGSHHIGNDDLVVFRGKLDVMKRNEFVWVPYSLTLLSRLHPMCLVGSAVWRSVVPLICFQIVEWHQPDRVTRQFKMQQPIPGPPHQPKRLHGLTLKGKNAENWMQLLQPAIQSWNDRSQLSVQNLPPQEGELSFNSEYMVWYRRKTKNFVDPKHAKAAILGEIAETLQFMVSPLGRKICSFDDLVPYVDKITLLSQEEERIIEAHSDAPPFQQEFETQEFNILRQSVETQGLARRRETLEPESYVFPPLPERQHGMYYTPTQFTQYSSQMPPMYSYPYDLQHQSGSSTGERE